MGQTDKNLGTTLASFTSLAPHREGVSHGLFPQHLAVFAFFSLAVTSTKRHVQTDGSVSPYTTVIVRLEVSVYSSVLYCKQYLDLMTRKTEEAHLL